MGGQRDRADDDGPVVRTSVAPDDGLDPDGDPDTPGPYPADVNPLVVDVYGEREQSAGNVRPAPGEAKLEPGIYVVRFVLTEEGFHAFGANQGGNYATVMRSPDGSDVRFTIQEDDGAGVTISISSGGGGCFVATATFGSPIHPVVEGLREFRDSRLRPSRLGAASIETYYRNSPVLACQFGRSAALRALARRAIRPAASSVRALSPGRRSGL
jgi:hypothetical protein